MSDKSGFRGTEARRRYLAVYDRVRSLSPAPDAVHDVATEFGLVRGYQHGPDGGVPLVLLHCFWATSAMWAEHIPALAGEFTVYTVDMLGQPGASVQTKAMVTADDCARYMNEVLDGLALDGVHLVGHSYGGWTAAQTAARKPGRLASVTLIEPCNTVARLSGKFWRDGALLLVPGAERKQRTVAELLGHPVRDSLLDSVMQLVMAAGSAFASFGTPFPRYSPDSLLRSVDVPVQVLLAGNTIHDSAKGIDRMRSVVPSWRYRLWPEATHMLPCEAVEDVTACIRDFAQQHAAG
ncbi:alpha/beta fold hydrolase [Mycolicibacterium stellerae]|uniref:alpha/beta fold hydrolase n=1 Tax=Mycolicibacterium stellerae TaxID=2358193 RepID=UPI000F0B3F37|nr:alpha/beta fold hydrolase [Mycolicibacterium stellerae]